MPLRPSLRPPLRPAALAIVAATALAAPANADTTITITSAPLSAVSDRAVPGVTAEAPGLITRFLIAIGLAPSTSLRPTARPAATAPDAADIAAVIRNAQRALPATPRQRLPIGTDRAALLDAMPLPPEALARLR